MNYQNLRIRQNELLFWLVSPQNNSFINDIDLSKFNTIASTLVKEFPSDESMSQFIISIFGATPINVNLSGLDNNLSITQVYVSIVNTIKIVQIIGMSIVAPIIIIMIFVLTSLMMSDIKKIISVLKTLGYSDKENILSILFTYLPIILVGLLLGFALFVGTTFIIQFLVYGISSIFISASISWLPYLYGALSIIAILLVNFAIMVISLKRTNLKVVINYLE